MNCILFKINIKKQWNSFTLMLELAELQPPLVSGKKSK